MRTYIKCIVFVLFCTIIACNKEASLSEYKYSNNDPLINCEGLDTKLWNEAIYSFEEDIKYYYSSRYNPDGKLDLVYSEFLVRSLKGIVPFEDFVSPHTFEVFKVLKTKAELWNIESSVSKLNYESSLLKCIASYVQNNDLKTTLNALLSTHSMNPRLFNDPLTTNRNLKISNDSGLRAYAAFDLFYARLFDVDETKIKERPKIKHF